MSPGGGERIGEQPHEPEKVSHLSQAPRVALRRGQGPHASARPYFFSSLPPITGPQALSSKWWPARVYARQQERNYKCAGTGTTEGESKEGRWLRSRPSLCETGTGPEQEDEEGPCQRRRSGRAKRCRLHGGLWPGVPPARQQGTATTVRGDWKKEADRGGPAGCDRCQAFAKQGPADEQETEAAAASVALWQGVCAGQGEAQTRKCTSGHTLSTRTATREWWSD